jgi:hypothetical protein
MSGRSSIDSLQGLASVSDAEAAAAFGAAGREELLEGVTELPLGRGAPRPRPAARRRRQLVLAVAALALAATATAATWVVLSKAPARETTSVQCLIGSSDAIIPSTSGNPAHDCAVDYRREFSTAAPRLVAYDNGLGGVTVIPHDVKPHPGWKRLVSGQDVDLIQLQDSLDDYIDGLNSGCFDSAAATSLTESKLARFGFAGWTVAVRNPGPSSTSLPTPTVTTAAGGRKPAPTVATSGTKTCVGGSLVDPTTETVTLFSGPVATGPKTVFEKLAVELRPLTKRCLSVPAAVSSVRATASSLGLSESARGYDLNTVEDNSMRCASIYETVGGTIFLTVRGPTHRN